MTSPSTAARRGGRDGRLGTSVLVGIVAVLVVLFGALGLWQLDRWGEARAEADAVQERLDGAPSALADVADAVGAPEDLRYQPVRLRGTWDTAAEVLWRNRSYRGQQGFHVLTPLVLAEPTALPDGATATAVLVDRGWVPSALDEPPVPEAAPVTGEVAVDAYLLPTIPQPGFGARDAETGTLARVFNVDVERLDGQVDGDLFPLFARVVASTSAGGDDTALPRVPDRPEVDTTQNLSYAVQWFAFAVIAVVATGTYLRRRSRPDGPADDVLPGVGGTV